MNPGQWLAGIAWDVRLALRSLARSPGFTLVVVLTLALAIGVNTAIFTVIDALVLRPLPVDRPEELVVLQNANNRGMVRAFNYPMFEEIRDRQEVFSGMFCWSTPQLKMRVDADSERVSGLAVSENFFSSLGVRAFIGRTLSQEDVQESAEPVAMISYRFWTRRFSRDPSVLGTRIFLGDLPVSIVGVTRPEFFGLDVGNSWEVLVPLTALPLTDPNSFSLHTKEFLWLQVMARPKPGVSIDQAEVHLKTLWPQVLAETVPPEAHEGRRNQFLEQEISLVSGRTGLSRLRSRFADPLFLLMAVAGAVLLIAAANVASLLLVRAALRQREIAVRLAVGAKRRHLVRFLLVESVILALVGGALGVLLAGWESRILVDFLSYGIPVDLDLSLHDRVLAFTLGASLLTGMAAGLLPVWTAIRMDPGKILKSDGSALGGSRSRWEIGRVLVSLQVAVSLCLLIVAGLFVRTVQNLEAANLGFQPENMLMVALEADQGPEKDGITRYMLTLLERVVALPAVESASFAHHLPLVRTPMGDVVSAGDSAQPAAGGRDVHLNYISPGYFKTIRAPLVQGRDFGSQDTEDSPKVAVIEKSLERQLFASGTALGRHIRLQKTTSEAVRVIGIVQDHKCAGIRDDALPIIYLSNHQNLMWAPGQLVIRTTGEEREVVASLRRELEVLKRYSVYFTARMSEVLDRFVITERMLATLSGFFGLVALLLVCIGVYGVMAYSISRRNHEIAIRMALGAEPKDIHRLVIRDTAKIVLPGAAVGLLAAVAGTTLASNILFGLNPVDPLTFLTATALLVGVALVAAYIPAAKASRLAPMRALRHE